MAKPNKTEVPKEPKIPLVKSTKALFRKRYKEIYLKEVPSDIDDKDLVIAVHSKDFPELAEKMSESKEDETSEKKVEDEKDKEKKGEFTEDETIAIKKSYFDLFGSKPEEDASTEEILKAVKFKNLEIEEAKKAAENKLTKAVPSEIHSELKEDEVLAMNKNTGKVKKFNKLTFKLLSHEWKEVAVEPKELK